VTVRDGRRFRLENARLQGEIVIATVKGISDRNAAEALKGLELHVERDDLPDADSGEFYQADLIGMAVFDDKGTQLGSIIGFQDFGAGDLIEVELPSGATGLVPFADSMVPIVDMDESRIVLSESGVAVLHADVELTGKTAVVQ
jgi:16S rRNA processing protein RimM